MKEAEVLALLKQDVDSIPLHAAWDDVAAEFGVDLPREYKVLVDSGDPIELFSFVFLINPFAPNGSFPHQNNPMIDFVRESAHHIESEMLPLWSDDQNILESVFPIGGTGNGSEVWLARQSFGWGVVVADRHSLKLQTFMMSLPDFLRKFILGELLPQQFPEAILSPHGWPLQ